MFRIDRAVLRERNSFICYPKYLIAFGYTGEQDFHKIMVYANVLYRQSGAAVVGVGRMQLNFKRRRALYQSRLFRANTHSSEVFKRT